MRRRRLPPRRLASCSLDAVMEAILSRTPGRVESSPSHLRDSMDWTDLPASAPPWSPSRNRVGRRRSDGVLAVSFELRHSDRYLSHAAKSRASANAAVTATCQLVGRAWSSLPYRSSDSRRKHSGPAGAGNSCLVLWRRILDVTRSAEIFAEPAYRHDVTPPEGPLRILIGGHTLCSAQTWAHRIGRLVTICWASTPGARINAQVDGLRSIRADQRPPLQ